MTKLIKKVGMYILNFPAFAFLFFIFISASSIHAFKVYFIESWDDNVATRASFWRWGYWGDVITNTQKIVRGK